MSCDRKNRIAQLILLTGWVSLVVLQYPTFVSSQECLQPNYSHQPIYVNSWLAGTEVTVQIDGTFSEQRFDGLHAGNDTWNDPLLVGCSGVTFVGYDNIFMADYEDVSLPENSAIEN